jgi:predicted RecB family nuclease
LVVEIEGKTRMEYAQGTIRLTATDVANHLSCKHLTSLNVLLADGTIAAPVWVNPDSEVLRQLGLEHERAYVQSLREKGLSIEEMLLGPESREATLTAMRNGVQAIVQANLSDGDWVGRADVLLRVEKPSALGEWSYEAADCKLSRTTKAETILQLCFYSELLAETQGTEPEKFYVILPHSKYEPESYLVSQFSAYYRYVKRSVKQAVDSGSTNTYPDPVPHCDVCRWWKHCDQQLRQDDSLSFVHGASKLQRKELANHGIATLKSLAELPLPIPFTPSKGEPDGFRRIREQARVQLEARASNKHIWEMLPLETGKGVWKLPEPSPGDIFFDLEGDPFTGESGIEYLFGLVRQGDNKDLIYECKWSLNRSEEKQAYEWFIDLVFERLSRFPNLHIYHFGSYETSAIKRLVLRYATKELEVDRLLRGKVFVDLHRIVKETVLAGIEQYSLKDIEAFYHYERVMPLSEAKSALRLIQHQLQLDSPSQISNETLHTVASYNKDDCVSTAALHNWLEGIRSRNIENGNIIEGPLPEDKVPSEEATAQHKRVTALFNDLIRDIPLEAKDRTPKQNALWLLAYCLDRHKREKKVEWWEFFRLAALSEEELYAERLAIAGMSYIRRIPKASTKKKREIDQYAFPLQDCSIKEGDTLYTQDRKEFGDVVQIDTASGIVIIEKKTTVETFHPTCVFKFSDYKHNSQSESIMQLAESIVMNGIDYFGEYMPARELLLRTPPRFKDIAPSVAEETPLSLDAITVRGIALDRSVLPIQGPPGSGKTFTAAHMICGLVQKGKKVGVTAVSHRVIRKLLDDVVNVATKNGGPGMVCGQLYKKGPSLGDLVHEFRDEKPALKALNNGAITVLGGTSFLWSRQEFSNSVDVLFVDEAGQISLANVLACARAGRNLVLLGDPQQLEQPTRGSHPEGSDISALGHLLGDNKTIDKDQGLFLAETRRLHPALCRFTSEMFYDMRLKSYFTLAQQRINGGKLFNGAGLWFVPVEHLGNRTNSLEEVEAVASIFDSLTAPGTTWINDKGQQGAISVSQILIVAPFNDQVDRLYRRLPGAQVGTVDRFQGQEGAIVIYSMTSSSAEDAPRGMEFLYDLHRFNVATSRARCACIVVGSPKLLEPDCRSPRQIELANALCRYAELGTTIQG